jgi:hypothetical protein
MNNASFVLTTPHHHADFDYDGPRRFDTGLPVTISNFNYIGRDVEYADPLVPDSDHVPRRFELWSPNATKIPVYPGKPPAGFSMTPPLAHPRSDGSGGRYDWTVVPQHFDRRHPHHPFIRKPSESVIEFQPLTQFWLASGSGGQLSDEYCNSLLDRANDLEQQRVLKSKSIPSGWSCILALVDEHPTENDISHFRGTTDWETCVHGLTYIQRQLREKDGWLSMISALRYTKWDLAVSSDGQIQRADENYIGVWVNGASEMDVRWFLHLGIPCFIIHEYCEGADFGIGVPESRNRLCSQSFRPPDVWHLDDNPYERVALQGTTTWLDNPLTDSGGPDVSYPLVDLARSASHHHGYNRLKSDCWFAREFEPRSIVWPSTELYSDRQPWLKPPPIQPLWKGRWTNFQEDYLPLEDLPVMISRGYNFKDNSSHKWYDRRNGRILHLDIPTSLPGVVNARKYGRPMPYYHFVEVGQGRNPLVRLLDRSEWVYSNRDPACNETMAEAPEPSRDDLPPIPPTNSTLRRMGYDDDSEEDTSDDGFSDYLGASTSPLPDAEAPVGLPKNPSYLNSAPAQPTKGEPPQVVGGRELDRQPLPVVLVQGFKPGTTVDHIADVLYRHFLKGGCGVSITGSATCPESEGTSFFLECPNERACRVVQAAWDAFDLDGQKLSVSPASASMLHGVKITRYFHKPSTEFPASLAAGSGEKAGSTPRSYSPPPSRSSQKRRRLEFSPSRSQEIGAETPP